MKTARLALAPLLLVALGAIFFSSTGRDDAHITFWPAHTLASQGAIVNYDGERVEQSSSLLLVCLLALLVTATGLGLPTLGSVVSIVAGAAAVAGTQRAAGWWAALFAATSASFVYWAFSGLETSLAALCGLWLVLGVARELGPGAPARPRAATVAALAAYLIVRPETGLVAMLALGAGLLWYRDARRSFGVLLGIAVVLFAALGAIRFAYFGTVFPQPVLVKSVGLSPYAMIGGLGYLLRHGTSLAVLPTVALAIAGAFDVVAASIRSSPRDPLRRVAVLFLLSYTAFIVCSGGDWMEGGRFFAHTWPVAAIVAAHGLGLLRTPKLARLAAASAVALQLAGVLLFARTTSTGMPVWAARAIRADGGDERFSWFERTNRIHRRDIPALLRLEAEVAAIAVRRPGPVRLLSGQMGMVPFHLAREYFGGVKILDMRGLTDRAFATCEITRRRPRSSIGLVMTYRFYFERAEELEASCGIAPPDIVYDLGEYYDDVVAHGYVPIYRDVEAVPSGSASFPGDRMDRGEFIAVRADLAGPGR